MPSIDKFSIICNEICTKQNGIMLNAGDDRVLRELFLQVGGNIEDLEQGVLSEFDTLKAVIIAAYESHMIASDPLGSRISTLRNLKKWDFSGVVGSIHGARRAAVDLAEETLGRGLLASLLGVDKG